MEQKVEENSKRAEDLRVGLGFATGRKIFGKVLKAYMYNWQESDWPGKENVGLNLFVAYDLQYKNTKRTDYTHSAKDLLHLIDSAYFIGRNTIQSEIDRLVNEGVIDSKEARILFGGGYAGKRNAILYFAIKNRMDYLLFLDDDEYPVAVTKTRDVAVWGGQQVLRTHLSNIQKADVTNGYHCGYISPIPYMKFDQILTETDFRFFIEAISNDIVNWDTIRQVMNNGGVTYADTKVLISDDAQDVPEINHAKFISGGNLCVNLTVPDRVYPFYNPPGARGEDTFLSTCLTERTVKRVPCYTFHDGFSNYNHLLDGVLPIRLNYIEADSKRIITRFYQACIGWMRYKPLFLYITQRALYDAKIAEMRSRLEASIPKVCTYFQWRDFQNVITELNKYDKNVVKHYGQYRKAQYAWAKIMDYLSSERA